MDIFKEAQFSDSKIDQFFFLTLYQRRNISWPSQIVYCPVVRGLPEHQRDKSEY